VVAPAPVDLSGVGVLVTRPEQQAAPLRRLIEIQGGNAFMLPAIEVKPHPQRRVTLEKFNPAEKFDLLIFVSANAVRFGVELLEQRSEPYIAAIGPATARALNKIGYRVNIVPERGFDSESLLAHPPLTLMHGQRVLIVKGKGGRDTLAQELGARGAEVQLAEVYIRTTAKPSPQKLEALHTALNEAAIQVVTINSLELSANLVACVTPTIRAALYGLPWIVPSERVAAGVRKLGVRGEIVTAASAEDYDVLAALLRWRTKVSGA
jgi:uroporphyrinogen-III synthase